MSEPRERARSLRKSMTDTERRLWAKLRNRRFAGFKFRRQVPLGPFIADFVCFDRRMILELDGGQHTQQQEYDAARTRWLEEHGFRVVRFWNHELWQDRDAVEELIWQRLHEMTRAEGESRELRPLTPDPSPIRGEGSKK
jgi:very-short-patch-repair endonuclease